MIRTYITWYVAALALADPRAGQGVQHRLIASLRAVDDVRFPVYTAIISMGASASRSVICWHSFRARAGRHLHRIYSMNGCADCSCYAGGTEVDAQLAFPSVKPCAHDTVSNADVPPTLKGASIRHIAKFTSL